MFQERIAKENVDVTVLIGNIVNFPCTAVVNAANSYMLHNVGVAAAIQHKAWKKLENDCRSTINTKGPVKVTENIITLAYKMSTAKHVIHLCLQIFEQHHQNNANPDCSRHIDVKQSL